MREEQPTHLSQLAEREDWPIAPTKERRRLKPMGILFWALVAWGALGSISHVSLGHEWLRLANSAGVPHWPMALLGIALTAGAATARLSLISRNHPRERAPKSIKAAYHDHVGRFYALVSSACALSGAVFANAGLLGRWPHSSVLWALHSILEYSAVFVGGFAAIALGRVALKSKMPVFKVPALIFSFLASAMVLMSLRDFYFGAFGAYPSSEVCALALIALGVAVLKTSFLTPSKRTPSHAQHSLNSP